VGGTEGQVAQGLSHGIATAVCQVTVGQAWGQKHAATARHRARPTQADHTKHLPSSSETKPRTPSERSHSEHSPVEDKGHPKPKSRNVACRSRSGSQLSASRWQFPGHASLQELQQRVLPVSLRGRVEECPAFSRACPAKSGERGRIAAIDETCNGAFG